MIVDNADKCPALNNDDSSTIKTFRFLSLFQSFLFSNEYDQLITPLFSDSILVSPKVGENLKNSFSKLSIV